MSEVGWRNTLKNMLTRSANRDKDSKVPRSGRAVAPLWTCGQQDGEQVANGTARRAIVPVTSLSGVANVSRRMVPVRTSRREPTRARIDTASPKLRFHHYRGVQWILTGGPMAAAYVPVVVHDECRGCLVCTRTTEWFMEFARLARCLTGINLRDCLHWGHLFDNPKPLIVPTRSE